MENEPRLYDVHMFGTDPRKPVDDGTLRQLSELLHVSPGRVAVALRQPGTVIRREVSLDEAERLQVALLALGVRCNFQPTAHREPTLELTAKQALVDSITCPSCGRYHEVAPGSALPTQCEACGVVFHKFHDVRRRKNAREQTKSRPRDGGRGWSPGLLAVGEDVDHEDAWEGDREPPRSQSRLLRWLPPRLRRHWAVLAAFLLGLALGAGAATVWGWGCGHRYGRPSFLSEASTLPGCDPAGWRQGLKGRAV